VIKKVLSQIKKQTLVGWTSGYLAAICMNGALAEPFGWKFWTAVTGVLLIRMSIDFIYAFHDAKQVESA
jgi:hypothetical protein